MNFYNDNDRKVCAWLRELIARGLIPPGIVDERPIEEIKPDELEQYTQCHFFAGIGGWSYAIQLADWPADVPVWTGSCPCQPFSCAGQGKGTADKRHLWPEFRRLIETCKPPAIFGEQVASKSGREWLSGVRADLEALGYEVGAADLCAASVGAPHIRQRLYWVAESKIQQHDRSRDERRGRGESSDSGSGIRMADSIGKGFQIRQECSKGQGYLRQQREGREAAAENCAETFWGGAVLEEGECGNIRRVKPGICLLAHGVPARVVRLRGYGNAIVPQVAATFVRVFMDCRDSFPIDSRVK